MHTLAEVAFAFDIKWLFRKSTGVMSLWHKMISIWNKSRAEAKKSLFSLRTGFGGEGILNIW